MECWHHSCFGNGLTLNGPSRSLRAPITVIQNSATGSPCVIFGDDLTIRTQSKNAANNGKDVDGIRTHGANTPDNPVFIITGDRTSIYVDGQDGDGINAGYNSYSGVGKVQPTYTSATICIFKPPVIRGVVSLQTQ